MTAVKMMQSAEALGWQVETDNSGQYVIYTGIPEGAPEVAQQYASEHGFALDSDNYGAILLYTGLYEPDMRLCEVWIRYESGVEDQFETWLNIDDSIEDQIYTSFSAIDPETPQITDFKWDLVKEAK
tara:strand:+ start:30 stop:410 length:381 start_codon:yes stop_codon:yes gene_type:complete